ncbi:dihydropteroate synthase [Helicobacter typhlonius]|uniref:dihydropteroate synthase n=1 Tax=Helicobacter typhlonius TaxID=76936 RepID=UPI002FE0328E
MTIQRLDSHSILDNIKSIGADSMGQKIMGKKAQMLGFEIKDLGFEAMNILKQEALSVGAECATPKECITHKGEHIALLFGTRSNIEKILPKLAMQPFGLKALKKALESHLYASQRIAHQQTIMAIINVTPDSFYENSRKDAQGAIDRIHTLIQKEVGIIDIGAASSRPGSELIDTDVEIERLTPVIEHIATNKLYEKIDFSIDTYNAKTAEYALSHGFKIINDVSGLSESQMIEVAAQYNARVVLMHTKGTPKQMQSLTHTYKNLFDDIDTFFAEKITALGQAGVKDLIIDIGFGFAKDETQNIALIKHLSHFQHFGLPLLVGASRKTTIGKITGRETKDRLAGTLAMHLYALQNGANILRIHDEDSHIDMLKIYKAMQ